MNYRVIWREQHSRFLNEIWFRAYETCRDAMAIPRATETIERKLTASPATCGESRSENERVLIADPLTVV